MNSFDKILKLIMDEYKRTLSREVTIEFPNELREQRKAIGNKLKSEEYITDFDYYGKCFFECTITQNTIELKHE